MKILCCFLFCTIVLASCSSRTSPIKSAYPFETYINIVGTIDVSMTYKIKVEYRTMNLESKCAEYSIALGRNVAKSYEIDYHPKIIGPTHNLKIPLQHLESNNLCSWKPVMVSLCASPRNIESTKCTSLFAFIGRQDIENETIMACDKNGWCFNQSKTNRGFIDEFNKSYVLHVIEKRT